MLSITDQSPSQEGRDNPRAMARGSTVGAGPGLAQSAGNVSGIKLNELL